MNKDFTRYLSMKGVAKDLDELLKSYQHIDGMRILSETEKEELKTRCFLRFRTKVIIFIGDKELAED